MTWLDVFGVCITGIAAVAETARVWVPLLLGAVALLLVLAGCSRASGSHVPGRRPDVSVPCPDDWPDDPDGPDMGAG